MSVASALFVPFFTEIFLQKYNFGILHFPNSAILNAYKEVGSRIAEGKIDMVIFFSDPLEAQPHDPDIKALLRIANVYDVPFANNRSTADFMIHSDFFNREYTCISEDYTDMNQRRVQDIQEKIDSSGK